jgi:hypothetical protein
MSGYDSSHDYFQLARGEELSGPQREALEVCKKVLVTAATQRALVLDAEAELGEEGCLSLTVRHRAIATTAVHIQVDSDGRLDMWSKALHSDFSLCFNDKWEPDDCLGDLGCAAEVLHAIVEGRLRSEITLMGDAIVKSRDVLLRDNGAEVVLDTQWHIAALVAPFRRTRSIVRRLNFVQDGAS